jgi:uncharacterized protein (TIGR03437 family)
VVNGASFAGGPLAPDSAITITGMNLSGSKAQFSSTVPGDTITIYFTGIGPLDNPVPTGQPAPLGGPLSQSSVPVTVTIGDQQAHIAYVGLTPGSVSLAQANVAVPSLPARDYPAVITVGSAVSNAPVISLAAQ